MDNKILLLARPEYKKICIKNSKCLDVFINDPDWQIRLEVALQGYGLNILINDENKYVRKTVVHYCKQHIDNEEYKNILMLNNL